MGRAKSDDANKAIQTAFTFARRGEIEKVCTAITSNDLDWRWNAVAMQLLLKKPGATDRVIQAIHHKNPEIARRMRRDVLLGVFAHLIYVRALEDAFNQRSSSRTLRVASPVDGRSLSTGEVSVSSETITEDNLKFRDAMSYFLVHAYADLLGSRAAVRIQDERHPYHQAWMLLDHEQEENAKVIDARRAAGEIKLPIPNRTAASGIRGMITAQTEQVLQTLGLLPYAVKDALGSGLIPEYPLGRVQVGAAADAPRMLTEVASMPHSVFNSLFRDKGGKVGARTLRSDAVAVDVSLDSAAPRFRWNLTTNPTDGPCPGAPPLEPNKHSLGALNVRTAMTRPLGSYRADRELISSIEAITMLGVLVAPHTLWDSARQFFAAPGTTPISDPGWSWTAEFDSPLDRNWSGGGSSTPSATHTELGGGESRSASS